MVRLSAICYLVLLSLAGCSRLGCEDPPAPPQEPPPMPTTDLETAMAALRPLHAPLAEPQPGDWLAEHHEPGQTFKQYKRSRPVVPKGKRKVIYLQPLGDFNPDQRRVLDLTARFMALYFQREVKVEPDLPLDQVPARARRTHPSWGMEQILTDWVLDEVLKPRLKKDAACSLALTATDLWPGEGWNFVFGQASLRGRVGVWSIYRNGDPSEGGAEFRLCLLRTLKTATHETGHMFSMQHCIAHECNLNGSNHREESDKKPLWLCPECVAKVWWATDCDPVRRFEELAAFCQEQGLTSEAEFYRRSAAACRP